MTLRSTLGGFGRLAQGAARRSASGPPCSGLPQPPPPCPCPPPARPPCRMRPPDCEPATRHVRCTPPKRPPCDPCAAIPQLTCDSKRSKRASAKCNATSECASTGCEKHCESDGDRVARRLALAESARREDYEREVAERRAACRAPDTGALYQLCASEADASSDPPTTRGGEATPGACQIQDRPLMDPCAHRPRTIVTIDRGVPSKGACPGTSPQKPASEPRENPSCPPAKKITSRIIEGLSMKRRDAEVRTSCPRGQCQSDVQSCEIAAPGPTPPPPCRRSTIVEKLRRRGAGPCADGPGKPTTRKLHTTAVTNGTQTCDSTEEDAKNMSKITSQAKTDYEKFVLVLQERAQLSEVAQGRVVVPEENGTEPRPRWPAAGRLALPVRGAAAVQIDVSLAHADGGCGGGGASAEPPTKTTDAGGAPKRCDGTARDENHSWLSIKSLQNKFNKKGDSTMSKKGGCPSLNKNPPAPTPACGATQPPRESVCSGGTKKLSTDTSNS